jgi:hypothetical protein
MSSSLICCQIRDLSLYWKQCAKHITRIVVVGFFRKLLPANLWQCGTHYSGNEPLLDYKLINDIIERLVLGASDCALDLTLRGVH